MLNTSFEEPLLTAALKEYVMRVRKHTLSMSEEGPEGFYRFFKKNFVIQEIIDLNISWPSNFFRKYFMTPPINFSFLFRAYL